MNFSQRLDLKQSQNFVMTPQLQQAIKLLQMTNLELQDFVQQEIELNPLLEEKSSSASMDEKENFLSDQQDKLLKLSQNLTKEQYENNCSDYGSDKFDTSTSYEDHSLEGLKSYQDFSSGGYDEYAEDRNSAFATEISLRDYLSQQLQIQKRDAFDGLIGSYLIGLLDEGGYLREDTKEIAGKLMIPEEKVKRVLKLCQTFDPIGVFAKNLQECLYLQMKEKNIYNEAMGKLLENLPLLAQKNFNELVKLCGVDKQELSGMIEKLKTLDPKPAREFSDSIAQVLIPDILIEEKSDGGWKLELNNETLPKVALNHKYVMELNKETDEATQTFVKESQYRASWLLKSLEQRANTILRVSAEILRQQDGFFAYGIEHLRPMNLKIVAEELGLHESTISRVTAGKYMRCPKGTFELKYFFMSGITGEDGENSVSSESVKHAIKKLVDAETEKKILSDEDIVARLKEQDIHLARRTVTKYREAMNIPSSVHRRRAKKSL